MPTLARMKRRSDEDLPRRAADLQGPPLRVGFEAAHGVHKAQRLLLPQGLEQDPRVRPGHERPVPKMCQAPVGHQLVGHRASDAPNLRQTRQWR